MGKRSRAPPPPRHLHDTPHGHFRSTRYRWRGLRPWILGQGQRGIGGFACIPEGVRNDIQELVEQLDTFLGKEHEAAMVRINFQARVSQLVAAGHILLPTTLTDVAQYLGTLDTSSLL